MPDADDDPQLLLFRRQYLQTFEPDFLAWPSPQLLKNADAQTWLYRHLFDPDRVPTLPAARYQHRVLELLLGRIKRALDTPSNEDISSDLISCLFSLAALQDAPHGADHSGLRDSTYVTFTCLPQHAGAVADPEPTVTLLEHRHLVSGSQVTGYRTWEGSLHLASYLLSSAGQSLVRGKSVLELGAGAGFLSVLCAKHLNARSVTATDGDELVVKSLGENIHLNGFTQRDIVSARVLQWGQPLSGSWVETICRQTPYDIVVGADITYDPDAVEALAVTVKDLFALQPQLQMVISGVIRRSAVFELFKKRCFEHKLHVEEVQFNAPPMRQQRALFYAAAFPIKIVKISFPTTT